VVTPGTLSVKASRSLSSEDLSFPNLQISQYLNVSTLKQNGNNVYSEKDSENETYLRHFIRFAPGGKGEVYITAGPSQPLSKIIQATASTGEIFPKPRPVSTKSHGNLTFQIETISPGIRCGAATKDESNEILAAAYTYMTSRPYDAQATLDKSSYSLFTFNDSTSQTTRYHLYYFAMVPSFNTTSNQAQPLPLDLDGGKEYSENYNTSLADRLWIAVSPGNGNATSSVDPTFISCQLWNVSYTFNTSFSSDRQTTILTDTKYLNPVQPMVGWDDKTTTTRESPTIGGAGTNAARMTYTMFFLGICERLTGIVYTSADMTTVNVLEGGIRHTVLTGSTDYFDAVVKGQNGILSETKSIEQSLQPTNKSISSMIEELSANVTSNMLGNTFFRSVCCFNSLVVLQPLGMSSFTPQTLFLRDSQLDANLPM